MPDINEFTFWKDYADGLIARGYGTRVKLWKLKYPEKT